MDLNPSGVSKFDKIGTYLMLLLIIYFVFFQRIGSNHLRPWDESMFAVNSYEMMTNGHYFTPYFKGIPDQWNSKTPLQIWAQIVFIKILGYNEIAIRLPSALSAGLLSICLFLFVKRFLSVEQAWFAFLVFCTSAGLTDVHMAKSGDADALLSLLLFLSCSSFFKFLNSQKNNKHLIYFFLFITLAFLTKTIAAFLMLPGLLIFALITKNLKSIILNPVFILGLGSFSLIACFAIFAREIDDPGYFQSIISNDFLRIINSYNNSNHDFNFYFHNFGFSRFDVYRM
jgi:4-amino-4-deoxy-L-arabinose transferase-like glycosyltransferase